MFSVRYNTTHMKRSLNEMKDVVTKTHIELVINNFLFHENINNVP